MYLVGAKYTMRVSEILQEKTQAQRKQEAQTIHDQFFTRPVVAAEFARWVKSHPFDSKMDRIIEPAAGNQDLARHFPGIEMFDIDPQHPSVKKQDFLSSSHPPGENTLVVMNPPFGSSSDLAIKFFNKAASFATYIAQIVPRTFRRSSIQDRLNQTWELVDEYVLGKNSFYLPQEGPDVGYDVPAVAQIWKKSDTVRPKTPSVLPTGLTITKDRANATFAFRFKGRRAGQIITSDLESIESNSFVYLVERKTARSSVAQM